MSGCLHPRSAGCHMPRAAFCSMPRTPHAFALRARPTVLACAAPNDGNGADLGRYSWTQSLPEVVVSVPVPPGSKGRACDVVIGRDKLRVGLRGQPPVLGELCDG